MSRQVVIGVLVVLIIGILGGTLSIVVRRLTAPDGSLATGDGLPASGTGGQQLAPGGDEDNDGLTNAEEARWGSDPFNPDTDGDGFLDGQEVSARHNPTIAGPNDALPPGFVLPGEEETSGAVSVDITDFLEPVTDSLPVTVGQPLNPDIYFVEGLTFHVTEPNLTAALRTQVGGEPTQEQIIAFARSQSIQTSLPFVPTDQIRGSDNLTSTAIQSYLDSLKFLEDGSSTTDFRPALEDLLVNNDTTYMTSLINQLQQQREDLGLVAPVQAVQLHRLFLAYNQAVIDLLQSVVSSWSQDRVRALVALRQLDAIDRRYAPIMEAEIDRIEESFN